MLKKFKLKTFGCQMNVYDSQKISNIFYKLGYKNTFIDKEADIYIINTCHIRDKAKQKLYSELGKIYKIRKNRFQNNKNTITIVAGCVAQAEGEEIFKRVPFVDIIVGSQSYQKLPNLIKKIQNKNKEKNKQLIELDFDPKSKFDDLPKEKYINEVSSYLTIQEGCDKFCKFCVVPYTRGPEYSRTVEEIVREAEFLIKNGTKEIILLGQNVNAYHGLGFGNKEFNLGKLIYVLAKIQGLKRIRYMTAHPKDMHEDLYNAHRDLEKLMPFLHLPIQSGSNKILKAMNRNYTVEEYLKIINKAKEMESKMRESQEKIKNITATGVSGSNSIKVTINGEWEMIRLEISDETLKEEKTIIEDLIVAAHNNAKTDLKTKTKDEISKTTGGFGIPGFKWPL